MWKFINSHKTKMTGAALVALGAIQANAGTVQTLVPPRAYAWLTVALGVLVAVLGFINGSQKDEPPSA